MSSSKQLIINCGASNVTAAVVSNNGKGLHVDQLVTEDLQYDYSNDDAWLGAVGEALQVLTRTYKFSGKAAFLIPGNQVLTKTIRIPHVDDAKRAQIIAFEAQQNIPYPLHEVVWDSQVVGDDGVETEVLFIACKSNTVADFCACVKDAGLVPETINAATVLDYNALQLAYKGGESNVLLINFGARSTNLLFKSDDGFFVRNIPLGGNSLTQNIADSLGKSFAQAQEIKHKFFTGELEYSDEDSGAKLLLSCSEAYTRRLNQEITRSVVNYRRQKGAPAPEKILLNGRGALLRGMSDQIAKSQKLPVELFSPLKEVALDGEIGGDIGTLNLQVSEIIGHAAQGLIGNAAGVNLLPDEIQSAMQFASKKPFLIAAAVCLAIAPWPAFLAFQGEKAAYEKQAQAIQREIGPLQARQSEIFENIEQAEKFSASIQRVEGLVNSKSNWIQFFAELQGSLHEAEDVWIDGLEVSRANPGGGNPSYEVLVEGKLLVRDSVEGSGVDEDVLTNELRSLKSSFESSAFVVSSKSPNIDWSSLRKGLKLLPFSITLVVDPTKPL